MQLEIIAQIKYFTLYIFKMTTETEKKDLIEQGSKEPETDEKKKPRHRSRKTRVVAGMLIWTLAACESKGTPQRVAEDKKTIENTKKSIDYLIDRREENVRKFNELVRQSNADPDNIEIQISKGEVLNIIKEQDEELRELREKYLEQNKTLDRHTIESMDYDLNHELPEHTRDFMRGMTL